MTKVLFILFQGAGTNLRVWNEYVRSRFLDRLKEVGEVSTYQDKVNNVFHYDRTDPEYVDFDADIDFGLKYVRVDSHVKMVYDDIAKRYGTRLAEYALVPIGWSAGAFLALYFAQKYHSKCAHVVLLDPAVWTPTNMKLRLRELADDQHTSAADMHLTNARLKKMLGKIELSIDKEDIYALNSRVNHIRSTFISKNLKMKLAVPTTAFVNVDRPERKATWSKSFNNETRLREVEVLKKANPGTYEAVVLVNAGHHIFDKVQPAKRIIGHIQRVVSPR